MQIQLFVFENKFSMTMLNKSNVKNWNTLGYLDQNVCRGLRLWNSWDREAVYADKYIQRMEAGKHLGPWIGKTGSHETAP